MKKEFLIQSEEQLRQVIPEPKPATEQKVIDRVDDQCISFISQSPLICLATSGNNNKLDVSPKGDAPGFVKVQDEKTLLIPERPGNRLAMGFRNILETGRVGVIFLVPGITETLRINGTASISKDPALLELLSANGKPALLCTIVNIEECFLHCGKAFIRSALWKPESWQTETEFNAAQQLADTLKIDQKQIQEALDDSYKNRLY
ncbi:MAG: MSMEG_1061 family FMN-dependent PPOX-type flavoprotein [Methyloligellaceae bacterium]